MVATVLAQRTIGSPSLPPNTGLSGSTLRQKVGAYGRDAARRAPDRTAG